MSKAKINRDVKSTAEINELKIKRNMGELTPDVIQMCNDQLDEMVKTANAHNKKTIKNATAMKNALKSNPEMLALVCKLADQYEEVLRWNRLINAKKIPMEVTVSHREVDMAMFNKIRDTYRATYAGVIAAMLVNYAYARLPPTCPSSESSKK